MTVAVVVAAGLIVLLSVALLVRFRRSRRLEPIDNTWVDYIETIMVEPYHEAVASEAAATEVVTTEAADHHAA